MMRLIDILRKENTSAVLKLLENANDLALSQEAVSVSLTLSHDKWCIEGWAEPIDPGFSDTVICLENVIEDLDNRITIEVTLGVVNTRVYLKVWHTSEDIDLIRASVHEYVKYIYEKQTIERDCTAYAGYILVKLGIPADVLTSQPIFPGFASFSEGNTK